MLCQVFNILDDKRAQAIEDYGKDLRSAVPSYLAAGLSADGVEASVDALPTPGTQHGGASLGCTGDLSPSQSGVQNRTCCPGDCGR